MNSALEDLSLGIKLSYLRTFIEEVGPSLKAENWTTSDVCQKYVKEKTEDIKASWTRRLMDQNKGQFVSKSQWFISHAWDSNFLDVIESIEVFFEKENLTDSDPVVWLSVLSVSQHEEIEKPFEWWRDTFTNAVGEMGNMLMVMVPWNNPEPIRRAWCVFELYACVHTKSNFNVVMPSEQRKNFLSDIRENARSFFDMLGRVDSKNSKSYYENDKKRIHDAIERTIGFNQMDHMMLDTFKKWMISVLRDQVSLSRNQNLLEETQHWNHSLGKMLSDQGYLKEAETHFFEVWESARQVLGENHEYTLTAQHSLAQQYDALGKKDEALIQYEDCASRSCFVNDENEHSIIARGSLATFYSSLGRYDEAEPILDYCLQKARETLGRDHHLTLSLFSNLASLCKSTGNYNRVESLVSFFEDTESISIENIYMKNLKNMEDNFGRNHPDTLSAINNLASFYKFQGKYQKAHELFVECLEKRKRAIGEFHPLTLKTYINVASLLGLSGNFKEAEALHLQCLNNCEYYLGRNHPDTINVINSISQLYLSKNDNQNAENYCIQNLELSRQVFGEDSSDFVCAINNLASLRESQNRLDEAESYYNECLEKTRQLHGEDSHQYLSVLNNVALLYGCQGKLEEAEKTHVYCLERMRKFLGEDHPMTLTSMLNLGKFYSKIGKMKESQEILATCVTKMRSVLGLAHQQTLIALGTLYQVTAKLQLDSTGNRADSFEKENQNQPDPINMENHDQIEVSSTSVNFLELLVGPIWSCEHASKVVDAFLKNNELQDELEWTGVWWTAEEHWGKDSYAKFQVKENL
ncbi:Kinesin light chain 3 [Nowakowskiella sp. JEL0078]|nr:Kinesin light chain 3 [Nowakowskiella sp. JEL0078]